MNASLTACLQAAEAEAAAGRIGPQFDRLLASLELAPRPHAGCTALLALLRRQRPRQRHAEVDRVWQLALNETWARPAELAPMLLPYLALSEELAGALAQPMTVSAAQLDALEADALLHALLASTPPPSLDWERLLATLAGQLLSAGAASCQRHPRLLESLVLWAQASERLALPAADEALIEIVHAPLLAACRRGQPPSAPLLAWAFLAAPPRPADWDQWLPQLPAGALVQRLLAEPLQEAALAVAWPPPTVQDADLAQQYEESPYPRWRSEPRGPLPPPPQIARALPAAPRVLLAGCGTGQQVMRAADRYSGARLTALDFSRASLAHAQRACAAAGLTGVEWRCGDLLGLAAHSERYDLVECIGVLHHLPDPSAGLEVLAGLLAPGGLLCAAVYSARARASIAALRAQLPPGTRDVHGVREALIRGEFGAVDPAVTGSVDFYSRSGCRDLLLNVRERQYRLPELVAQAQAAGFDWLQLEAPAEIAAQATAQFARPAERLSPGQWDAFEASHPRSFGGMFQVWFRRR